jgi:hypothetical protein
VVSANLKPGTHQQAPYPTLNLRAALEGGYAICTSIDAGVANQPEMIDCARSDKPPEAVAALAGVERPDPLDVAAAWFGGQPSPDGAASS